MLNKDALAGVALQYNAMYRGTGLCGIGSEEGHPTVRLLLQTLSEMFEGETPLYEKISVEYGTGYYKSFKYNGVKFFATMTQEEYEDATF